MGCLPSEMRKHEVFDILCSEICKKDNLWLKTSTKIFLILPFEAHRFNFEEYHG